MHLFLFASAYLLQSLVAAVRPQKHCEGWVSWIGYDVRMAEKGASIHEILCVRQVIVTESKDLFVIIVVAANLRAVFVAAVITRCCLGVRV